MKKFYLKNVRIINDLFHLIIGFGIMYDLGVLTEFYTYTLEGKIIGVTFLSIMLGIIFGFAWELYWFAKKLSEINKKDILRTTIGFLAGGLLAVWVEPSQTVWILTTAISIIILVFGVASRIKKK